MFGTTLFVIIALAGCGVFAYLLLNEDSSYSLLNAFTPLGKQQSGQQSDNPTIPASDMDMAITSILIESSGGANTSSISFVNSGNTSDTIISIAMDDFGSIGPAEMSPEPALIPPNSELIVTFDAADMGLPPSDAERAITLTIETEKGNMFTPSMIIAPNRGSYEQNPQLAVTGLTVYNTAHAQSSDGLMQVVNSGGSADTIASVAIANYGSAIAATGYTEVYSGTPGAAPTIPANDAATITFNQLDDNGATAPNLVSGQPVTVTITTTSGQQFTLSTIVV